MNRRTVIKALGAAPLLLSGFSKEGFASASRTPSWPERLDLVNPVSARRFEMRLKGDAPIRSESEVNPEIGYVSEFDRADNPRFFQYSVRCVYTTDAVVLTGVQVNGSQDVKLTVTIDGEPILKGVDPATATAAEIKSMYPGRTDIFRAETPKKVKAGIFMPNGTMICVFAERGPVPAMVKLEMALYTLKDPCPSADR